MSETVHHKGTATKVTIPNNKSLEDFCLELILDRHSRHFIEYYDSYVECLCNDFSLEFYYHKETDTLYKLDNKEYDLDDEIIEAKKQENGTINYELRYYNGGAGFHECMDQAFNEIK